METPRDQIFRLDFHQSTVVLEYPWLEKGRGSNSSSSSSSSGSVGRSVVRLFPVLDRVSASLESAGHLTRGQFTLPSKIRQAIIFVRDGEGGEGVGVGGRGRKLAHERYNIIFNNGRLRSGDPFAITLRGK